MLLMLKMKKKTMIMTTLKITPMNMKMNSMRIPTIQRATLDRPDDFRFAAVEFIEVRFVAIVGILPAVHVSVVAEQAFRFYMP